MICRFDVKTDSQCNLAKFLTCLPEGWLVEENWGWLKRTDGKRLWACRLKKAGKNTVLIQELKAARRCVGLSPRKTIITELEPIKDVIEVRMFAKPDLKEFLHRLPRGWIVRRQGQRKSKDWPYYALLEGDRSKWRQLDRIRRELGLKKVHCNIVVPEEGRK